MATDQEIRDAGFKYIPQQKYLQNPFELPTADPVTDQGIVATNAFTGSGGDGFNPQGNMFGEGTAVSPVFGNSYIDTVRREGPDSFAAYNKLSQAGGTAPAGMFQTDYFPGTQNELADAMGRMPGQENYDPSMNYSEDAFQKAEDKRGFLSKLMNNAKQGMGKLPGWAQAAITAAGMINPFTAVPKLLGMGSGDGGPSYGIAGLSDAKKGSYDALASQGMLYQTPGGFKTLTGKNFQAKNYVPNQLEIYDRLKDIEEEELTNLEKKQLLESSAIFKDNKQFYNNQNINAGNQNQGGDGSSAFDPSGPTQASIRSEREDKSGEGQSGGFTNPGKGSYGPHMADGGRAGYFFGGRVNYKQGGEIAGPGDTGGEGGEDPQDQSDSQFGGGGDNNNNPPPTFYDNGIQVLTDKSELGFNYPTGLTKNLGIGQLTAILDARKSLKEEEPEGMIQYDSSIGPVDTKATFDTTTGPEFNASYTNNNFNANLNNKTGLGVNYSKDIGPGTFTMAGTYNPDGTYNTEAKYGISFANGGLASIL